MYKLTINSYINGHKTREFIKAIHILPSNCSIDLGMRINIEVTNNHLEALEDYMVNLIVIRDLLNQVHSSWEVELQ